MKNKLSPIYTEECRSIMILKLHDSGCMKESMAPLIKFQKLFVKV